MLNNLQRRGEGPVALGHGAAVALLRVLRDGELLEELAEKQENHARRGAILGDLFLVPRNSVSQPRTGARGV